MKNRGYILMEVLVAGTLLSIAGSGLYAGISRSADIMVRIRETSSVYSPLKIFYAQLSRDLRNAVPIGGHFFVGEQDQISFQTSFTQGEILQIKYSVENQTLIRSEAEISSSLQKSRIRTKVMLQNVERIRFEYGYLDSDEVLFYKPYWSDQPYFGIPKVVKSRIFLKKRELFFERLFSLPQGRFGHEAVL